MFEITNGKSYEEYLKQTEESLKKSKVLKNFTNSANLYLAIVDCAGAMIR